MGGPPDTGSVGVAVGPGAGVKESEPRHRTGGEAPRAGDLSGINATDTMRYM